jgi:Asp-tRNA(Asn)/Glu-tRNA(Gln) amidotransferase A subunit family amidase
MSLTCVPALTGLPELSPPRDLASDGLSAGLQPIGLPNGHAKLQGCTWEIEQEPALPQRILLT